MPFPVACSCGQRFMAQDHLSGKEVPCPACGNALLIQPPSTKQPVTAKPAAKSPVAAQAKASPPAKKTEAVAGIAVRCACGKAYKAPAAMRGKTLKCPACGKDVPIPLNAPPARAAAPAAAPDPFGTGGGSPLGGDLFGADPFGSGAQGSDPLSADLFGGPLAGSPLAGGPLTVPVAGFSSPAAQQAAHTAYGAPQGADDGGGNNRLLVFLGVGVGVVLLGLLVGIWLVNRNDTPVVTNSAPPTPSNTAPATNSATSVAPSSSPATSAPSTSSAPGGAGPTNATATPPGVGATGGSPAAGSPDSGNAGPIVGVPPATAGAPGSGSASSTNPMGPLPGSPGAAPTGSQVPGANPAGGAPPSSGTNSPAGSSSKSEETASRPAGKALGAGLTPWHTSGGKLVGVRKVGEGDNLQAHYSWMTQILPFIGRQEEYSKIDFSKPLTEKDNLQIAGRVIPEFLNPGDDRIRWKGYPFENMALTHFVGMSGIEDARNVVAAKLPRSDPRAGVFGYDAIATPAEITDGTSNTIMVLGGGELASPWVMGGGNTIRGARLPYFDKITGFGSKGTSGVIVLMADGSVRQISSNVDPAVFRALCTIHGAETIDLEKAAPLTMDK